MPMATAAALVAAAVVLAVAVQKTADSNTCVLLSGTFGTLVQCVLGLLTVASLALKWQIGGAANRSQTQFLLDSFKNCCGAASLHVTNLLFATLMLRHMGAGFQELSDCHFYWIEIMIDTTLGSYVEFVLFKKIVGALDDWGMSGLAKEISAYAAETQLAPSDAEAQSLEDSLLQQQQQQEKVNWPRYFKQIFTWIVMVQLMKVIMILIIVVESPQLSQIASFMLYPFSTYPRVQLVFVMVVTPVIMNSLQFWVQDDIFVSAERANSIAIALDAEKQKLERIQSSTHLQYSEEPPAAKPQNAETEQGANPEHGAGEENGPETGKDAEETGISSMSKQLLVARIEEMEVEIRELKSVCAENPEKEPKARLIEQKHAKQNTLWDELMKQQGETNRSNLEIKRLERIIKDSTSFGHIVGNIAHGYSKGRK